MTSTDIYGGPIIVLVGPSGAGKTTLADFMAEPGSLARVPTVTTRKPRRLESSKTSDHIFLTNEEFDARVLANDLVCVKSFPIPGQGTVSYGVSTEILDAPYYGRFKVIVLDPDGAIELSRLYSGRVKIFWLTAPSKLERVTRLAGRGDSIKTIVKRLEQDSCNFGPVYDRWDDLFTPSITY